MAVSNLEYRVLVCGGRNYSEFKRVGKALEIVWLNSVGSLVVIEGGATGADQAAKEWAEDHAEFGVMHLQFPANWKEHRRAAGPIRNAQMLNEGCPDLCIWFPGGKGTQNMISQTRKANIPCVEGEMLGDVREALGINNAC